MSLAQMIMEARDVEQLEGSTEDAVLLRLYDYWRERRGTKRYPSRADIDPVDFGFALGRVSLVDVLGPPRRFHYRLASTNFTDHLGYEMTGKFADEIPASEIRADTEVLYTEALAHRAPIYARNTVVLDGWLWAYEALTLPMSADDRAINMLMIYQWTERLRRAGRR